MKINESALIEAGAAKIWQFVAVPSRMGVWNPKIVSVDYESGRPVALGDRFTMVYRMSGKNRTSKVEVIACEPEELVVYRHEIVSEDGRTRWMNESYSLKTCGRETKVEQVIDLDQAGIPWFWRMVIGVIQRFGRPAEECYLSRLKRTVEAGTAG